jgi:inner membrane protein YidH
VSERGFTPGDATRRTQLAVERTQLAWWRTGLTALAVAIGVGRVVPELNDASREWPYVALGVGFALYAIAAIWFGGRRGQVPPRSLAEGEPIAPLRAATFVLTVAGAALALATAVLIVLG